MSAEAATTQAAALGEAEVPEGYSMADLYPASRLKSAAEAAGRAGLDALLLTPGPDLRYLTGYDTHQSERLTCLAVPAAGPAFLVVPRLELASALTSSSAATRGRAPVKAPSASAAPTPPGRAPGLPGPAGSA